MTGSYHNYFRIYDVDGSSDVILQADKSAFKTKKVWSCPSIMLSLIETRQPQDTQSSAKPGLPVDAVDFSKKILHGSWHPRENTVAVGFTYCHLSVALC